MAGTSRRSRDYAKEYAGRRAKAAREGRSVASARGHAPAKAKDFDQLSSTERLARARAVQVPKTMRREGLSLGQAARREKTTPDAVLRYIGQSFEKDSRGRWVVRESDSRLRLMAVIATEGVIGLAGIPGSAAASLISKHLRAVNEYIAGKPRALQVFVGQQVEILDLDTGDRRIVVLETRSDRLDALKVEGDIDDLVVLS